ncbi:SigB/SigF/SigG family RNA polymerase sigma factor [Micromonospora sp. CPCC 206061]|uniref:SigB/SigF/SigG family RNA polymerase sigma factor n=1 Tax=Micromonospora sp. CPCC 206061 TaxID=3122410 RepID=UPI002FF285A5
MTRASTRPSEDLARIDTVAVAYADRVAGLEKTDAVRRAERDRLVTAAMPFAGRLARRYRGRGEPLEDLEQVARLGLLKAVNGYDPARGSFTGYAAITITGELRRHFRDRTWGVHVPRRMQEMSLEVSRTVGELTRELSRSPTIAEIAHRTGVGEDQVLIALETATAYAPVSLQAPTPGDSGTPLVDLIGGPDGDLSAVDDRVTVSSLLCRLPARERQLLAMRFYGNRTQSEIAAELGISQMHVSRLLSRALTWLREAMLSDAPHEWQASAVPSDRHELAIRAVPRGAVVVVEVAGEVDRDTAPRLRDALLSAMQGRPDEVRVDLGGVAFVDAAGIGALLCGLDAARGAGIRLTVGGTRQYVRQALRVAGLGAFLAP